MQKIPLSKTSTLQMKPQFEVVYRGKMFEVVRWEGKPGIQFEAALRAPGVRLLIETKKDGMKALLMTKEIRRETGGADFRLPGGKVFDSLDELDAFRNSDNDIIPLVFEAARKESKEEAGINSGNYEIIEVSKAGASVEWDLYYIKVTDPEIGEQELEEYEEGDIETIILSPKEIFDKLSKREIKEGRSADILWLWLEHNKFIRFQE